MIVKTAKQKSYQADEKTEELLGELREGFGLRTDSAVIRRALTLAKVMIKNADDDHTITVLDRNNRRLKKIILNG